MSCSSPDPPAYCSEASSELKLYQAFIFSVPVFFTFVLLFLFYLLYLRRRRANWQTLRMRADFPRNSEMGLKKEVREMLPVVVFKESFLIRETQCSVCLGDYKSDERLQRIPPCGHTFHVDCIDHWFATNTTCPLCRVSLLPSAKASCCEDAAAAHPDNLEQECSERPNSEIAVQGDNEAADSQREPPVDILVSAREGEQLNHQRESSTAVVEPQQSV